MDIVIDSVVLMERDYTMNNKRYVEALKMVIKVTRKKKNPKKHLKITRIMTMYDYSYFWQHNQSMNWFN